MEMVNKDMTIGEVLVKDMNAARIFIQHGMHCLGCPHSQAESIEQAGMVHGVDVEALVGELNEYFTSVQ
jgi:hybrid cluster-associated redox disulfide protein